MLEGFVGVMIGDCRGGREVGSLLENGLVASRISGRREMLCSNCNSNLLINKSYLLRIFTTALARRLFVNAAIQPLVLFFR